MRRSTAYFEVGAEADRLGMCHDCKGSAAASSHQKVSTSAFLYIEGRDSGSHLDRLELDSNQYLKHPSTAPSC